MKRIRMLTSAGALLMLLFFAAAGQEKQKTASERMDEMFEFWNRLDEPGYAMVVVKGGQVVYQKGIGLASLEHLAPITTKTPFHACALAESFTGMAVAMLEVQGKLSLDDDIRKVLPELPDFGARVTFRHLLHHTSGLRDWRAVLALTGRDNEEMSFDRLLRLLGAQKTLATPPGTRVQHSSTNYDLLAEAVSRITGRPFVDWTWENIFRPLKMTHTQFRAHFRDVIPGQAIPYNYDRSGGYQKGVDLLSLAGSHSLFTCTEDLAKWIVNLETGQVGGKEVASRLLTSGLLPDGKPSGFSYGLRIEAKPPWPHGSVEGSWAGGGATFAYFPRQQLGIVLFANWDYSPPAGYMNGIARIYLEESRAATKKRMPPRPGRKVKVDPATLDRYAGQYRLQLGADYSIVRQGGSLMFQAFGASYPLSPLSPTQFYLKPFGGTLTFQKNAKGEYSQLTMQSEDEGSYTLPRVRPVAPKPEQLQEYVGAYRSEELDVRYSVEMGGSGLLLSTPTREKLSLRPDEPDRFIVREQSPSLLVFSRDREGHITGFFFDDEARRDIPFTKI